MSSVVSYKDKLKKAYKDKVHFRVNLKDKEKLLLGTKVNWTLSLYRGVYKDAIEHIFSIIGQAELLLVILMTGQHFLYLLFFVYPIVNVAYVAHAF